jgi:DNA-binding transcriptional MerR regulator
MSEANQYTIEELARLAGVSCRTVRFYVQRELIPPPDGRGLGRHYRAEHLQGILRIRELQRQGKRLGAIKAEKPERNERVAPPRRVATSPQGGVTRICLAREGVWLEVADGVALPTAEQLENLAELCRQELGLPQCEGQPSRLLVRSKSSGMVMISDGLGEGRPLRIAPGQSVEITEITPALQQAVERGLVEIATA